MPFTRQSKGSTRKFKEFDICRYWEEAEEGSRGLVPSSFERCAKDFGLDSVNRYPMGSQ